MIHDKPKKLILSSESLNVIDLALEQLLISCEDPMAHGNVGIVLDIIRGKTDDPWLVLEKVRSR